MIGCLTQFLESDWTNGADLCQELYSVPQSVPSNLIGYTVQFRESDWLTAAKVILTVRLATRHRFRPGTGSFSLLRTAVDTHKMDKKSLSVQDSARMVSERSADHDSKSRDGEISTNDTVNMGKKTPSDQDLEWIESSTPKTERSPGYDFNSMEREALIRAYQWHAYAQEEAKV